MTMPPETASEDRPVVVLGGSDSMSGIVEDHTRTIPIEGNNDCWRLIPEDVSWSRCHISPSYFRQGRRWNLEQSSVILNLISDPDQNPRTLRVAERITADYRERLINDPRHVRLTRRDDNARTLQDVPWLHVPKVMRLRNPTLARLRARAESQGFLFPAIVRRTGTQTGKILGLFQQPEDMKDIVGDMKGEYYFTEFVDCRWSDGMYRKMRLFSIGDEVILRHLLISDHWQIHGRMGRQGIMKERDDLRAEERACFEGGAEPLMQRAREAIAEIRRRIKLDFFGMDCGPTEDGGMVLFEANATMNITPSSDDSRYDYTRQSLIDGGTAFSRLLRRYAGT